MIRKLAFLTCCVLSTVAVSSSEVLGAQGGLKKEVNRFTAMTQLTYVACHAEVRKNATEAQFLDRELTLDETTGCSSKAEAEYKPEFRLLLRELKSNKAALAALKDYYSEWIAAIEGGIEDDPIFYESLGRLRKKAAALDVELE